MTTILGINAYHADASASLLVDGQLSGAIEEERLNRVKHCTVFPSLSVAKVMDMADVAIDELAHVAIGRDPKANLAAKIKHVALNPRLGRTAKSRVKNASLIKEVPQSVMKAVSASGATPFQFHYVEHHRAHIASAFYCSTDSLSFTRSRLFEPSASAFRWLYLAESTMPRVEGWREAGL